MAKSLAITGESRDFYAQRRIDWTAECVARLGQRVHQILDYGCGDGTNSPLLAAKFAAEQVLGVDVSAASIDMARGSYDGAGLSFLHRDEWIPDASVDLAFCNGVFHHIAPVDRGECLTAIRHSLRPGGLFAFWENNPWNLGTRYVMSQCVFDENAIMLSPREARRLLTASDFKVLRMDSLFYFPRQLRLLRPAERWFRSLLFGGQYQVLCQNLAA